MFSEDEFKMNIKIKAFEYMFNILTDKINNLENRVKSIETSFTSLCKYCDMFLMKCKGSNIKMCTNEYDRECCYKIWKNEDNEFFCIECTPVCDGCDRKLSRICDHCLSYGCKYCSATIEDKCVNCLTNSKN